MSRGTLWSSLLPTPQSREHTSVLLWSEVSTDDESLKIESLVTVFPNELWRRDEPPF